MTAGKNQDFTYSYLESQLCIPQDRLEDIEFFPNFGDDLISLKDVLLSELVSLTPVDDIGCKQEYGKDFCSTRDIEDPKLRDSKDYFDNREGDSLDNKELSSEQEIERKVKAKSLKSEDFFEDHGELSFPVSLEQEIQERKVRCKPLNSEHSFDGRELSFPVSLEQEIDQKGPELKISSSNRDNKYISLEQGIEQNSRALNVSSPQHNNPVYIKQENERSGTAPRVSLQRNQINNDSIRGGKVLYINKKKPRTKKPRKENKNLMIPLFTKQNGNRNLMLLNSTKGRSCIHCQAENTPQWRMGPTGPKTLCNACGVRYKSGRLVPEYRPAASPSFDSTKHSNFHRRIMQKKIIQEKSRMDNSVINLF